METAACISRPDASKAGSKGPIWIQEEDTKRVRGRLRCVEQLLHRVSRTAAEEMGILDEWPEVDHG